MTDLALLLDGTPPPRAVRVLARVLRAALLLPETVSGAVLAIGRFRRSSREGLALPRGPRLNALRRAPGR